LKDAEELANFAWTVPSKINLIEYNPIEDGEFEKSSNNVAHNFMNYLNERNLIVNLRRSRGEDIDAACGQLANRNN
jgi:23S rRNA (adenine2503-C2)-methyltransferase